METLTDWVTTLAAYAAVLDLGIKFSEKLWKMFKPKNKKSSKKKRKKRKK